MKTNLLDVELMAFKDYSDPSLIKVITESNESRIILLSQSLIAKVALDSKYNEMIEYEYNVLCAMKDAGISNVPLPIELGKINHKLFIVMTLIPGHSLTMPEALFTDILESNLAAINEFLTSLQKIKHVKQLRVISLDVLKTDVDYFKSNIALMLNQLDRLFFTEILQGFEHIEIRTEDVVHGDFNISNIIVNDDLQIQGYIDFTHLSVFDRTWDLSFTSNFCYKATLEYCDDPQKIIFFSVINIIRESRNMTYDTEGIVALFSKVANKFRSHIYGK
jgi:hypothetical protein